MAQIILLTGEAEAAYLKSVLQAQVNDLSVTVVYTIAQLENAALPGDRLISFLSPFIVPLDILKTLSFNCFNFHPAPPNYPGYHPASFAIYNQAPLFGTTFHAMAEKVDSGTIIKSNNFEIIAEWNYVDLSEKIFLALIALFRDTAPLLVDLNHTFPANGEEWGEKKYTKKDYTKKRCIPRNTPFKELQRRFSAFECIYSSIE